MLEHNYFHWYDDNGCASDGPNTVNTQVSISDIPGPQYPPHFCLAAE